MDGCQPLREAVSWNFWYRLIGNLCCSQPLREAVSWNCSVRPSASSWRVSLFVRLWVEINKAQEEERAFEGQPLREAVSWNLSYRIGEHWLFVSLFVRLWVEIYALASFRCPSKVSLFVRLWVEIQSKQNKSQGREVSLFVRLWVEIKERFLQRSGISSASSWGCELK